MVVFQLEQQPIRSFSLFRFLFLSRIPSLLPFFPSPFFPSSYESLLKLYLNATGIKRALVSRPKLAINVSVSLQLLISASRVLAPLIYYVVLAFSRLCHGPDSDLPPSGRGKSVAIILLIEIESNRLVVRGVFRVCARVLNAFHLPAEVDYAPPTSFLLLPSPLAERRLTP